MLGIFVMPIQGRCCRNRGVCGITCQDSTVAVNAHHTAMELFSTNYPGEKAKLGEENCIYIRGLAIMTYIPMLAELCSNS